MPLLKANIANRARESAIVMDLGDLEREAAELISRARSDGQRLVDSARDEATRVSSQIREDARAAGHAAGYAAGLEEGRKTGHDAAVAQTSAMLNDVTARWSQALELLHQHMPAHVADARTDLVKLALAIAAKVTHAEALRNRQVVVDTAAEALRLAAGARLVTIRVQPAEVAMLESYLPALLAKIRTVGSVELAADETITPGGVVATFGGGEVDARMETQLQRIAVELLGADAAAVQTPNR